MRLAWIALAAALAAGPVRAASGPGAAYKLATWNLDWLTLRAAGDAALPADVVPRQAADFARLRHYAAHLDADVVALQEVEGAAAARQVFDPAAYSFVFIRQSVVQQVGLAVRRGIAVTQNPDVTALDVEAGAPHELRNGLDATLRFPDGAVLRVLAVHLKTGCHRDALRAGGRAACALLARQVAPLRRWAQARAAEGGAFAVLGDFNREMDAPEPVGGALDAAGMARETAGAADPCWSGGQFIDHIFLGGAARGWMVPGSLRVMLYRGAAAADRARLSDHCPVSVRLAPG